MTLLKIVYIFQLIIFSFIVLQEVPRYFSLALAVILIIYIIFASIEDAIVFFSASIPLFIALPLTRTFDSFNTWRIIALIIFIKWIWTKKKFILPSFKKIVESPKNYFINRPVAVLIYALLLISIISILPALNDMVSIKRIIYFINLSFIGIVLYDHLKVSLSLFKRVLIGLAISTIVVTFVGILQL
ncbi:MAG: hypothetical protein Q7R95_05905, partial [bacterium]|nr:hypothetical protein [bacterium]